MDITHYQDYFPDARLAKRGALLGSKYFKAEVAY